MTEYESARAVPTMLAADVVDAPTAIPAVAMVTTRITEPDRRAHDRPPDRAAAMRGGVDDLAVIDPVRPRA